MHKDPKMMPNTQLVTQEMIDKQQSDEPQRALSHTYKVLLFFKTVTRLSASEVSGCSLAMLFWSSLQIELQGQNQGICMLIHIPGDSSTLKTKHNKHQQLLTGSNPRDYGVGYKRVWKRLGNSSCLNND